MSIYLLTSRLDLLDESQNSETGKSKNERKEFNHK